MVQPDFLAISYESYATQILQNQRVPRARSLDTIGEWWSLLIRP